MNFDTQIKRLKCSLKGAISETLILNLFKDSGWQVHRFGMEYSIPGFCHAHIKTENNNEKAVRTLPDFVIRKGDRTELLEVKYRTKDNFNFIKEYEKRYGINHPFPNTYFLIVSPNGIKGSRVHHLKKNEELEFLWRLDLGIKHESVHNYHETAMLFLREKENPSEFFRSSCNLEYRRSRKPNEADFQPIDDDF